MFKNFFFTIFLSLFFVSFLEASNEKINQQIFELKTSQDYAQKINDEKITLIMGQIIQKENEIKKLEKELKEYVNKEDLEREINYQNNRIEDINSSVDKLSNIIAMFGVLITIIVIFFAFRFERIARVQADKEVKSWIDEKADKEFKPKVDSYLAQIDEKAKKLLKRNEDLTEVLENRLELLDKENFTEEEKKELEEEAEEIKSSKNEQDYTFEDRYKLFIPRFVKGEYLEALEYLKVLEKENLKESDLLAILMYKSITLSRLNRDKEAIEVYNEIINRYKDSKDDSILEQVSVALINKIGTSLILNKKNRSEDLNLDFELITKNRKNIIKYRILILLEKAKNKDIDEEIISWKEEFKDTFIEGWSFKKLKTWANSFEDDKVKERLLRYIDIFEKHNESIEKNQSNI